MRTREPSHPVNAAGRELRRWKSYEKPKCRPKEKRSGEGLIQGGPQARELKVNTGKKTKIHVAGSILPSATFIYKEKENAFKQVRKTGGAQA